MQPIKEQSPSYRGGAIAPEGNSKGLKLWEAILGPEGHGAESSGWLGLPFGLVIVLLIAFLSYRGWAAFDRHADQLDVTQRMVAVSSALLSSLTDAETGQRGYLLTGEDSYLAPYRRANANIPALLRSLRTEGLSHADQAQRIESLTPLVNAKLAELALTIELRRSKGLDAALAVVRTDRGRALMEHVRGICAEIQTVTNGRLARYSERARSRGNQTGLISILGGASLFVLLLVATIAIRRGVARRQSLIGELEQSERRLEEAAAQAEAANRAKSTFLSTMSHEIRTPMNAILGYAQLMLRDPRLETDAKANLEIIGRSGQHLLALINDVLDMSKIEAGRIELNPVTFNLPKLLDDLAVMFRQRAEAKALRFDMSIEGECVDYVAADEGKIRQALINLLGNAIKFTERGRIQLLVTVEQRSGHRLWLAARVEDTGLGMTDAEQKKLFEPFSQVSGGLNKQEGTGLGLAISRHFARLMGGDLTVSSRPGGGSTFQFDIPIEPGDASAVFRRSAPRRVIGIQAGTQAPRILVVDDRLENRDWLMKLLTAIGFSVRSADSGEAAIRNWEAWKPRLILMDVHMPGMNGIEATRRIKADPRGKETVIVTLTASAMEDDRRVAADGGADAFLAKPVREDELLEKMRVLLGIVYDYEEISGPAGPSEPEAATLGADRLGQLPRKLIEEILGATSVGDKNLLGSARYARLETPHPRKLWATLPISMSTIP